MTDIIVIAILAVVLGSAIRYIYKAKKRGQTCIGCPNSGVCGASRNAGCNCSGAESR